MLINHSPAFYCATTIHVFQYLQEKLMPERNYPKSKRNKKLNIHTINIIYLYTLSDAISTEPINDQTL